MTLSVSILATGSEILDGRVLDTNSNFVARELADMGLKLKRVLTVDDDLQELIHGLRELAASSDIVITSGGLGPTSDDLTRDAVAAFSGVGLSEHPAALKHVEEFFARRSRPLDATNRRQAVLPQGASMIHNERGSAPGFSAAAPGGAVVCSLSGVPSEFQQMFRDGVVPLIEQRRGGTPPVARAAFKTLAVPESALGKLIEGLALPPDVLVSYRAAFPEVHIVLKSARKDLGAFAGQVRAAIGPDNIFTERADESFVGRLQGLLCERKLSIATAESCTGGMVAELLTRTPGSSAVFRGSVVAYHNDIKERELGVPAGVLSAFGAVSAETVRAMAAGVRERMQSDIAVAISGVAGPDGGSDEKPVGTFFVGVASGSGSFEHRCLYAQERQRVRTFASFVALDLVRRHVLGLATPGSYPIWV